jgi:hypothetical protein
VRVNISFERRLRCRKPLVRTCVPLSPVQDHPPGAPWPSHPQQSPLGLPQRSRVLIRELLRRAPHGPWLEASAGSARAHRQPRLHQAPAGHHLPSLPLHPDRHWHLRQWHLPSPWRIQVQRPHAKQRCRQAWFFSSSVLSFFLHKLVATCPYHMRAFLYHGLGVECFAALYCFSS